MTQKSNIRIREITHDSHLEAYNSFTSRFVDVCYPYDYLKRAKVMALVSENHLGEIESILGGYILALKHPFRVLEQIPDSIVENHTQLQKKWDKCFEITGLWIHPTMKNGVLRFRFWWKLFMDLVVQNFKGKSHILYSYDSSKKKLGEMYSLSKPCRIFEGLVYIPGMSEANHEIVEMGSVRAVMKAFFARPHNIAQFILKRLFRNRVTTRKALSA